MVRSSSGHSSFPEEAGKGLPTPSLGGKHPCFTAFDTPSLQHPDSLGGTQPTRPSCPDPPQATGELAELASPPPTSPQGRKPPVRPPQHVKSSCCLIVRQRHLKKRFPGRLPHRKLLGIILLLRRENGEVGKRSEKGGGVGESLHPSRLVEPSACCGTGMAFQ